MYRGFDRMHARHYCCEVSRNHGDGMNVIEPAIMYMRGYNYTLL